MVDGEAVHVVCAPADVPGTTSTKAAAIDATMSRVTIASRAVGAAVHDFIAGAATRV
jgi:hypothetical protein